MPEVSIVIPIYKVELKYFTECMESVLGQTFRDIEVIIVDDGADEELVEEARRYEMLDKRVFTVHQENKGAAAARNAGLDCCGGQYITFVDSDDYILGENIEEALYYLKKNNLQVLLWGSYKCYKDRREKYMPYTEDIGCFTEKQKEQLMMKTMVGHLPFYDDISAPFGSGSCCSKMYDVEFLRTKGLRYPEGIKRAEDVNFNIRVFDAADRIGYLNRHFYFYRQLPTSATYQYRENGIQVFTDALLALKSFLVEKERSELFYQVYYMRCMFFFLESMDMDYLNKNTKKPIGERLLSMKRVLESEPYCSAIKNLKYKDLTFFRRIPLFLMRRRWVVLLAIFYYTYGKIKA